jgi:hypothetical protein
MDVNAAGLCYLEASKVMGPTGVLDAFEVWTRHDESLGSVDGVLIDPESRNLRFFVIEASGWRNHRRYLLPVEAGATMTPEGHGLRLEMETDAFTALDEFDMGAVRAFTDEDAIAPTLSRYLA